MGATAGSSRGGQLQQKKFMKNRKGNHFGGAVNGRRPLLGGSNNWFKVQVNKLQVIIKLK